MITDANRLFKEAVGWANRNVLLLAWITIVLTSLPFVFVIENPTDYDVVLYRNVAADTVNGTLPYRDRVVEYPPYAVLLFLLPRFTGDSDYPLFFEIFAWTADIGLKLLLVALGLRQTSGVRALFPLFSYSISVPFLSYFYLQRYDIFPAVTTVAALAAFSSRRYALAGALFAVGAGLKLYPMLFIPPLLVVCWREGKAKAFLLGTMLGFLPIVALTFFLPWWRFLQYHNERGLQVESLYVSVLWLAHLCGFAELKWEFGHGCLELHGHLADGVLPWARASFSIAVIGSTAFACWTASRSRMFSVSHLARLLMVPLFAFVAFNQVLSPQYLIWLLPLTALASIDSTRCFAWAMLLVTVLTSIVYPSKFYGTGLQWPETWVLLFRNMLLVAVWLWVAIGLQKDRD